MDRSLQSEYTRLAEFREPFLKRAWDAAKLTIPGLLPEDRHNKHSELPTPYQGVGAQGVSNLSAKLLLATMPPSQPFFALQPAVFELEAQVGAKVKTEVEESLVKVEKAIQAEIDTSSLRLVVFEALKHLVVTGNSIVHIPEKGHARAILLDQYVAVRAPDGTLERLIIKEQASKLAVDERIKSIAEGEHASGPMVKVTSVNSSTAHGDHDRDDDPKTTVVIYTGLKRVSNNKWAVHQEVNKQIVPGTEGEFNDEQMPYIVLRMSQISGESYGRGLVEELMGDLVSLEGLAKSIVQGSAAMARLLFLVDPSSSLNPDDLNSAPNGAFRQGRADDISALQVQKQADFSVAASTASEIETRLNRSFLMNTAVQRQAERVTAAEIRFVAQELESALGGVFSSLSRELQIPLVNRVMAVMKAAKRLPDLPKEAVTPKIITGMAALGRAVELQNLDVFSTSASKVVGPDQLNMYLRVRNLLGQLAAAAGVDTSELLRSEEEVQESEQQARNQAMIAQLGPQAIKSFGPAIAEQAGLPGGAQPQE